jgi:ligand-binding SRPBCC domain-containing protein
MIIRRFKKWRHLHKFIANGEQIAVKDVTDFELPYGVSLRLFEDHIYKMLWKTFNIGK